MRITESNGKYLIEVAGVPVSRIGRYIPSSIPDIPGDSAIGLVGDHGGDKDSGGIISIPCTPNCGQFESQHAVSVKKILDICLLLEKHPEKFKEDDHAKT